MTAATGVILAARTLGRPLTRIALASMTLIGGCTALAAAGIAGQPPLPNTPPSALAVHDIPPTYLPLYLKAAKECLGLPWTVLAGIGKVATDHGRRLATPDRSDVDSTRIGIMGLPTADWTAHGTDTNHDGHTNPNDPADAIPAATHTLCALQPSSDLRTALSAYWCANQEPCTPALSRYTDAVLAWAGSYATLPVRTRPPGTLTTGLLTDSTAPARSGASAGVDLPLPPGGIAPDRKTLQAQLQQVLQVTLTVAVEQLGTPYRWGGEEPGGFDCSGLVQYAYAAGGLQLPRTAQQQHNAGPHLSTTAMRDSSQLYPGDLLFFGTSTAHVTHVGMYVGLRNDIPTMIVAPHTGSSVQFQTAPLGGTWLVGATRPLARYLTPAAAAGTS